MKKTSLHTLRCADIINTISPPPTHACNQAQLRYFIFFRSYQAAHTHWHMYTFAVVQFRHAYLSCRKSPALLDVGRLVTFLSNS